MGRIQPARLDVRHHDPVDQASVGRLSELLSGTSWIDRTRGFARSLRRSTDSGDGLLLVGTPTHEPWHLAAHLDDESRYAGLVTLSPTLVRWSPPPGAPGHLAVGLDRIEAARRGETLFVVAPDDPTEGLLERLADARRSGATLLSIDVGDDDLSGLVHDQLVVPARGLTAPGEPSGLALTLKVAGFDLDLTSLDDSFETVQHLVSTAAADAHILRAVPTTPRRRGLRERVAHALDSIQGVSSTGDW
jgi:hypothetical protein